MPHILMIATGGTIACCETAHGLSPALDSAALLGALPELSALCTVETLDLMQLDSTDVTAADRQRFHLDITVPGDQAAARIDAAVQAGGRVVDRNFEPSFTVLADADGNLACVCTELGRE